MRPSPCNAPGAYSTAHKVRFVRHRRRCHIRHPKGATGQTLRAQIYDVDLFNTPAEQIAAYHERGIEVVCYFSAGWYEEGRPDSKDETDMGALTTLMQGGAELSQSPLSNVKNTLSAKDTQLSAKRATSPSTSNGRLSCSDFPPLA